MLQSGKIDLAIMTSFKNENTYSGSLTVYPLYNKDSLPGYNFSKAILTNKSALENKKVALDDFVKSMYEVTEYIKNNPDYCVSFIEKEFSLSPEESKMFYNNYIKSLDGEDFILDTKTLSGVRDIVIDEMKLKNVNTEISGFSFTEFAKNASSK
jgi:ABC-type nitrate/sulfonate/bicarbonate transport system substrate-binding protein